jgi:hypothetical protein
MLAPGFTRMPAAAAGIGFTNVLSDALKGKKDGKGKGALGKILGF